LPSEEEDIVNRLGAALIGWTISEKLAVCVCAGDPLSVTVIAKFDVPLAAGVPEMTPPLESVNPDGKPPEAIAHVYPGVPPLALNAVL
jgi:hypothetical protein